MDTKTTTVEMLQELIERAKSWPEPAQEELLRVAQEIEADHTEIYHATPEELEGIRRGIEAATVASSQARRK